MNCLLQLGGTMCVTLGGALLILLTLFCLVVVSG